MDKISNDINNILEKTNIVKIIIRCFLNIEEINNTFLFLNRNKINGSNQILNEYYFLLKNQPTHIKKLEEEIKSQTKMDIINKKRIQNKKGIGNVISAILETFVLSLNIQNLFLIKKDLIEKCSCDFNKRIKQVFTYISSFDLEKRIQQENINISSFFESNETLNDCRKCKKKQLLLKSEIIYSPQILIIMLKYEEDLKSKIIYPKNDLNIKCHIKESNKKVDIQSLSYKLKILIIREKNNNYKEIFFSKDSDYNILENKEIKYPIIFFYQREKNEKIDNFIYNEENKNDLDNKNNNLNILNENINNIQTNNFINNNNNIMNNNINNNFNNINSNQIQNINNNMNNNYFALVSMTSTSTFSSF